MNTRYLRELIFYIWNKPKILDLLSLFIGVFTVLYFVSICFTWIISHQHFALKNVVLEVVNNKNPNINTREVEQVIRETANGTALNANLNLMFDTILENPWVDQVVIRRVWSNTIVIKLTERRVVAIWNEKNLVSQYGDITKIPVGMHKQIEKKLGCYLMKIEGPKDFLRKIIERARLTNDLLVDINEHLLHLKLTEQYSWEAKTIAGMSLRFGGDSLQSSMAYRLTNFTKTYSNLQKLLKKKKKKNQIQYVDLRYAKGFAVMTTNNMQKSNLGHHGESCLTRYRGLV